MNSAETLAAAKYPETNAGKEVSMYSSDLIRLQRSAFIAGMSADRWISVETDLPEDFDEFGRTQHYLVYIDNPFFSNGHYHVAMYEKSSFGEQYNHWVGIEPNVHHNHETQPKVIAWQPLPKPFTPPNP